MTWLDEEDGRLDPDAVAAKRFPAARGLRRGIDADDVREYLTWVAGSIRGVLTRYADQYQYTQQLQDQVMDRAEPGQVIILTGGDARRQAIRTLSEAQREADRYVSDARDYAGRLTADAEKCWHEMVDDAAERAEKVIARAEEQGRQAAEAARAGGPPPQQAAGGRLAAAAEMASLRAMVGVYMEHMQDQVVDGLAEAIDGWREQQKVSRPAAVTAISSPAVTSEEGQQ